MAVTAAGLIDPKGRILPDLFPGEDSAALLTRVGGWITQAEADTDIAASDAAVTAYVYNRAFSAVCDRLNVQAARLDFAEQGSRTMLASQLTYWATERDRAAADLAAILAEAASDTSVVGAPLPSSYSSIGFVF